MATNNLKSLAKGQLSLTTAVSIYSPSGAITTNIRRVQLFNESTTVSVTVKGYVTATGESAGDAGTQFMQFTIPPLRSYVWAEAEGQPLEITQTLHLEADTASVINYLVGGTETQ
jgi:hypothetical protein